ncbi:MAG TPA: cobalt ECF transporter T component CbiQ [Opitutaceae bacterium]|nr:cobalt ECF transporter T component CbiQ [Opitutaceae bacterium]HOR24329.1 cobalt ECF transporter T component CbiQ [Opitutaceae bacterium]
MLRLVDTCACANRWRAHSEAVALFCCGLMLCALLVPPWPGATLVLLTAMIAATAGARVPARAYGRALLLPIGFLATSAIGLCVSLSWADGLHLAYSADGARTAWQAGQRALAAISVTMLFAFTVPLPQWLALLRRLHTPEALLDLILLTYRMIFQLDEGLAAILRAQRNRLGYASARRALHSSGLAGGALFIRAIVRSARLERGLAARNYSGRLAVLLPPSATRPRHLLLAAAVPLALALLSWFATHPV